MIDEDDVGLVHAEPVSLEIARRGHCNDSAFPEQGALMQTDIQQPIVFNAKEKVGLQAALCLAGGFAFFLVIVVLFILSLGIDRSNKNDMLPGIAGGTSIIWIGLIARGLFLLRSVRQVVLDENAVHLHGFIGRKTIAWDQINRLELDKKSSLYGGKSYHVLSLKNARGKTIAQVPDTIENFGTLGEEIAARSSQTSGHSTYDPATDEQRQVTQSTRKAKLVAVLCAIIALAMGTGFFFGLREQLHIRRYATEGVKVDAKIAQRYMVRVTPYVRYTFRDSTGRLHDREVMMEKNAWNDLAGSPTIPVEYLPDDPKWNRPVLGEDSTSLAGPFLWLSGGMSLVFAIFCVTSFLGYDLKTENGVTRITRRGRTVRQWGASRRTNSTPPPQGLATPTFGLEKPGSTDDVVLLEDLNEPPPPYQPAMGPIPEYIAAQKQKPSGLFVLGIFAIVLGALGAGINVLRVVLLHNGPLPPVLWIAADALLAVLLIIVGAGLLGMQRWSRTLGILIAALQILSSIGSLIVLIVQSVNAPELPGEDQMMMTAARIGAGVGHLLGAIFPVVLLIILSKRSTGEAMRNHR
jgi:hypothetical protein